MSNYVDNNIRYRAIVSQAWPIILANSAVPLLGIVDTAVMGHFGTTSELAGLAVASLLFNFIYWGFGFLRMGTTGFVARAMGANDDRALMLVITQSMGLAIFIAAILLFAQLPLLKFGSALLSPPGQVQPHLNEYFAIRIWGAPATLATYVLSGVFIGRGDSRRILLLQLILNIGNTILDIGFAALLNMGLTGIALGTVIAEYVVALLAIVLLFQDYDWRIFFKTINKKTLRAGYSRLLTQNTDIFVRTLFLLLGFCFFINISGCFGEVTLAANHLLLQIISFAAFFLDGYAHVLESLAGKAFGRRSVVELKIVLCKTSVLAGVTACVLAALAFITGDGILAMLTDKKEVVEAARSYLPLVVAYIACSVGAYQLDGLYIGAGYSSAMRNASVISTAVLVGSWYLVFKQYGVFGLWLAFVAYVLVRAVTLLISIKKLMKQCG